MVEAVSLRSSRCLRQHSTGLHFHLRASSHVCPGGNGNQFFVPIGDGNYSHLLSLVETSFVTGRQLGVVWYACDPSGEASTDDLDLR